MTQQPRAVYIQNRLEAFQKTLDENQAILLANPNDIQYLTGFISLVPEEREALLLVQKNKATLLHAAFSPVEKFDHLTYLSGVYPQKISQHCKHLLDSQVLTNTTLLQLDETYLRVSELRAIETAISETTIKVTSADLKQLQTLRMHKDSFELKQLTKAATCAAMTWKKLEKEIQPGMTEIDIKIRLEQLLLEYGSQRPAFPTIVAFGEHAALPHHQPTDTILKKETAVLIDFGATVHEYRSDMTRTIWIGDTPDQTFLEIENLVKNGYQAALEVIRSSLSQEAIPTNGDTISKPSVTAKEIDSAARSIIKDGGYGKEFIHTTGHGVGLDIHEAPSLNWTNSQQLHAGAVITIEPGIYLEGQFGYRYENTVILKDDGLDEATLIS